MSCIRLACIALAVASPGAASAASILGSAEPFAVIGAAAVTNTGPTTIVGDAGVDPGTALTGTASLTHLGTLHVVDGVSHQAWLDAQAASVALALLPFTTDLSGHDLGGMTLRPGVYRFASSAQLTGTLTLDYAGDAAAMFVFQIGSTLTTASASSIVALNGDASSGLFFNVGSSATLGTGTSLVGNIIAAQSVTLTTGARIACGRAIALVGAVTLDTNTVAADCGGVSALGQPDFGSHGFAGDTGPAATAVAEPASWALLVGGFGLVGATARRRRAVVTA